jgi:hypothetical protein
MASRGGPADGPLADELKLYIDNDGQLYRQQTDPIQKNLCRRYKKGTYDFRKSVKLFEYLAISGAKKYHKEFGSRGQRWFDMFNVATRKRVAKELAKDFKAEAPHMCKR